MATSLAFVDGHSPEELEDVFRRWYPQFRKEEKAAA
jgi:hypothetical protein